MRLPVELHKLVRAFWSVLAIAIAVAGTPLQAAGGRSIVIDFNWSEIIGDASDGDATRLPFAVNYGAGLQQDLTVSLSDIPSSINGTPTYIVGLSFPNSPNFPSDYLYANVATSGFSTTLPAVFLSNQTQVSSPRNVVAEASIFQFGTMIAPIAPGGGYCVMEGINHYCYGPLSGSANFIFTDLSSTGAMGDFGLSILCSSICLNAGFSLGGLDFDTRTFDPTNAPTQLVSYSGLREGAAPTYSSFNFVFRNGAVPEPGTWAMMLLGFAAIGVATRRSRPPVHA